MTQYGVYYTFEEMREYLEVGSDEVSNDEDMKEAAELASRLWDKLTDRLFYPRVETRYYDHPPNPRLLKVRDDLLEVVTLTTNNGSDTVAAADYFLMQGDTYEGPPYDRIQLDESGDTPLFLFSETGRHSNALTGIWGYHEDWAGAWLDTGITLSEDITAAARQIGVSGLSGRGKLDEGRRAYVQDLLKIGSEYLYLVRRDEGTSKLLVARGANGTTAATHSSGDAIYRFRATPSIRQTLRRLAAYLYKQRDSQVFTTITTPTGATITIPEGMPAIVKMMAPQFTRFGGLSGV